MKKKHSISAFDSNTLPYLIVLVLFALATVFLKYYYLAAAEGIAIIALAVYSLVTRAVRRKSIKAYIESITYDADTAKNSTLLNFPLPIVVFNLNDSKIVWGNDMFFSITSAKGSKTEKSVAELVPEFSGKWLTEGKTRCPSFIEIGNRQYQIFGNIVRSDKQDNEHNFMAITYWLDVTEHEELKKEFERSKPVAVVITIDNFEELMKNQPERLRNDLRDAIGDKLTHWGEDKEAILIRFDRDRYLMVFEERYMQSVRADKFALLNEVHQIVNAGGIHATLSIGVGRDAGSFSESLNFALLAADMALSRGGDQAVIKNRFGFEFFGGKVAENEVRTKVKSRVMANAFDSLLKDASQVLVMGHKYSDMDSVGGAMAVCRVAKKYGKRVHIICDTEKSSAKSLIAMIKKEPEYKDVFISGKEAMLIADSRTLLCVVDTNRPEQVEDLRILQSCNKIANIDHHRKAATYIEHAAMSYIEPSASSVCELLTEMLELLLDEPKLLKVEAEAMLAGIVLDTKSFTIRTTDATFDAAAFLRRAGADTVGVKRLFQNGMEQTVAKYKILQCAKLYRNIAVAVPEGVQNRIVAAQAADELLNVAGVDCSMVMYPLEDGDVFVSARSIGDTNVQLITEKLGGGGNRAAAAAQLEGVSLQEAVKKLYTAIDEYMDS